MAIDKEGTKWEKIKEEKKNEIILIHLESHHPLMSSQHVSHEFHSSYEKKPFAVKVNTIIVFEVLLKYKFTF